MEPANASDPAPNAATLLLAREIVAMADVDDSPFDDPVRDAPASKLAPAIWAWAKAAPSEVRTLGEHLARISQSGDIMRMSGFCLLAGAHHDPGSIRPPFHVQTMPTAPVARSWRIEGAPSPWSNRKHEVIAKGAFGGIAHGAITTHDESRPILDSLEVLSKYELDLAAGISPALPPRMRFPDWQRFEAAVEQAGLPSEIALSASHAHGSSSRSPSL